MRRAYCKQCMDVGIYMNREYLEKFFRNLLLGERNKLKNRYCYVKYNKT